MSLPPSGVTLKRKNIIEVMSGKEKENSMVNFYLLWYDPTRGQKGNKVVPIISLIVDFLIFTSIGMTRGQGIIRVVVVLVVVVTVVAIFFGHSPFFGRI